MIPALPSTTIADMIPEVQLILQNRSDVVNYNPAGYIK